MSSKEHVPAGKLPAVCSTIDSCFEKKFRFQAFVLALGHAYNFVSYRQLGDLLKGHNVRTKQFSRPIVDDTYLMKNCKAFLLAYAAGRKPTAEAYQISPATQKLLLKAYHADCGDRLRAQILDLVSRFRILDLEQLDYVIEKVLTNASFNTYVEKFVNKKHLFLEKHMGLDRKDVKSDIMIACNQAILRTYPAFEDAAHIFKLCKRTAHNRGINIITENTAQCRNQFAGDKSNAYQVFSIEEMQSRNKLVEEEMDAAYSTTMSIVTDRPMSAVDIANSFNTISARLAKAPKKRLLLDLMRGMHDDGFTAFLDGLPNEDYAETASSEALLSKACEFVGVPINTGVKFLQSLRDFL